jgi:hypothetical protein
MEHLRVDPKLRRRPRPKRAGWAARETYLLLLQICAEFDLRGRLSPSYQDVDFLAEEWVNGDSARLELARQVIAEGLPAAIEAGLLVRDGEDLVIVEWENFYNPPKTNAERKANQRARQAAAAALPYGGRTPPWADGSGPAADDEPEVTSVTTATAASTHVTPVTNVTRVTDAVTCHATPHHSTPLHKEETHTSASPTDVCEAPTDDAPADSPPALSLVSDPKPSHRAGALQQLWNELAAPGLPRWREMSSKRRKAAEARLRERALDGPNGWREVIARINASPFLRGRSKDGWRASPDWILQPDSAAKVLEGKYDAPGEDHPPPGAPPPMRRVADVDPYAQEACP